jgi:hypothetical protein
MEIAPPPTYAGAGIHPDLHSMDSVPDPLNDPGGTTSPDLPTIQIELIASGDRLFPSVFVPPIRAAGTDNPILALSVGPLVHEALPVSVQGSATIPAPQAAGVFLAVAPWAAMTGTAPGVAAGVGLVPGAPRPVAIAQDPRGAAAPETRGWNAGAASAWAEPDRGTTTPADPGADWANTELALGAAAPQRLVIQAVPNAPAESHVDRMAHLPMPDPQGDGPLTHFALPGRATLETAIDRFLGQVDRTSPGRGEPDEPVRWIPASLALMAVVLASDAIQRFTHRSPADEEDQPRGAAGEGDRDRDPSLARFPGLPGPWSLDER